MTNEELEQLARLVAARILPSAELLTEVGNETKAAAAQLRNERAAMPEVTVLAAEIAALRAELTTRLPRRPRPWHLKWWVTAPPPAWWGEQTGWTWPVSRTAMAAILVMGMMMALLSGFQLWTKPVTGILWEDGQRYVTLRLTWWRTPAEEHGQEK